MLNPLHDAWLSPRARAYNPRVQADVAQFSQLIDKWQNNLIPLNQVKNFSSEMPHIRMAAFVIINPGFHTPKLLMPYNPNRLFFVVSIAGPGTLLPFNRIYLSFGQPINGTQPNAIAVPNPAFGVPLGTALGNFYSFRNSSIVDDLWITDGNDILQNKSYSIVGFEGSLDLSNYVPQVFVNGEEQHA